MAKKVVAVIGGGAAGLMAAGAAAEKGNHVILLEKMNSVGKKLAISGKGRCNLTTEYDIGEIIERFVESAGENRELLCSLVEKIELSKDKEILIHFRFRELEQLQ